MDIKDGSIVYSIYHRHNDYGPVGVYSRSYHDEFYFESVESARLANCHNIYTDKSEYKIKKYKVHLELIEDDVECDIPHMGSSGIVFVKTHEEDPDVARFRDLLVKDMEKGVEESLTSIMEDEVLGQSKCRLKNLKRGAGVSYYERM